MKCENAIKNWINMNEWLEDMDSDTFNDSMPITKAVWSATKFHIFGIKRGNKMPCTSCIRALGIDVELKDYHIPNDLREEE
jgi:hypothetical protein